ncbi:MULTISPECIES: 30S ribosomal protein S3 [Emticicia]|uniref:30S ribosomal protein S3 n=1 Tax=Emticicia TaxID=312278 RepID=UPI000C77CF29|nr:MULTISPECIES: 30S ribosomal protein S3 [Emticicia]PLK43473.1 30S ribosomal protein S3 [Emticicia sp. TH156]UTA68959.1 30S ribosomal protein S3 [Emticicia sp. 21SJ11W-3]
MGQKVNPVGLRLGYIRGWESNWYGGKTFAEKLVEDQEIRKYVAARIPKGAISKVVIERTLKRITLTIHTARPGVVIGKGGNEVDKIKEELKKLTGKDVQINIYEIKRPELDAKLIGESIAQQLEARISYRRAMKQAIQAAVRVGAQGIKVKLGGRLAGAEMARNEMYKEGRIPLHTLRADIDYAVSEALTVYGKIGIKVWVFKGEVFGKRDLTPAGGAASSANERGGEGASAGGRGGRDDRRGGGRDDRRGGGRDDNRGGGDRDRNRNNNRGGGNRNNNNNRGNNNRR